MFFGIFPLDLFTAQFLYVLTSLYSFFAVSRCCSPPLPQMYRSSVALRDLPARDPWRQAAVSELELMLQPQDRKYLRVSSCAQVSSPEDVRKLGSEDTVIDAFFVPESASDIDTVLRVGFGSLRNSERGFKFGRYFGGSLLRGQRQTLLLCRIAVGKSLARTPEDADRIAALPTDFQSLYSPGPAFRPEGLASSFTDQYMVFDAARIVPTHVLEMELTVSGFGMESAPACGLCGTIAVVRCAACESNFCGACDRSVHVGGTLARHTRAPLDGVAGLGDMSWCVAHPRSLCDRFCWRCGVEVCIECKTDGAHAAREHEFMTFDAAQARAMQELADLVSKRPLLSVRDRFVAR
jgi:hypothetical protein